MPADFRTRKIYEYFDIPNVRRLNDHVGLELEYEGITGDLGDFSDGLYAKGWRLTADHSLRNNGAEFISVPTHINRTQMRINSLCSVFDQFGKTPSISHRCSTHVHVNVTDKTMRELEAAYFLLLLLEDSLFDRLPSDDRKENLFALRSSYYNNALERMIAVSERNLRNKGNIFLQTEHFSNIKYMGMSVYRTRHIGTVEFRILPAFRLDQLEAGELTQWARVFVALVRGMANIKTFDPLDAMSEFIEVCNSGSRSVTDFFHQYYDENSAGVLVNLFDDGEGMLEPENSSVLFFLAEMLSSHKGRYASK